jgi:hypothetical protein
MVLIPEVVLTTETRRNTFLPTIGAPKIAEYSVNTSCGEVAAAAIVFTKRNALPGDAIPAESGRVASTINFVPAATGVAANVNGTAATVIAPAANAVNGVGDVATGGLLTIAEPAICKFRLIVT